MIETERLTLRRWRTADLAAFHAMGQDAEVMRYYGPRATMADCRYTFRQMTTVQASHGHCFWALERRSDRAFIGFCGILPANPVIGGEVEIGWQLARGAWGQGLATEAARASLRWAWSHLDVPAVAAVTVPANRRSRELMLRLGMSRVPTGDFDHPELAARNPLRRHLLYRIARPPHG